MIKLLSKFELCVVLISGLEFCSTFVKYLSGPLHFKQCQLATQIAVSSFGRIAGQGCGISLLSRLQSWLLSARRCSPQKEDSPASHHLGWGVPPYAESLLTARQIMPPDLVQAR